MSNILSFFQNGWFITGAAVVLAALLYKVILRVFFGLVIVPEDRIGLVTKKFVLFGTNKELQGDRIIATNGEAGYQAKTLSAGLKWGYWPWQYSVDMQPFKVIPEGHIGLISSKDGSVPQPGCILGRHVECDNFQDAEAFLMKGGQKGRQAGYIPNGTYKINTFLFEVSAVEQSVVQESMVGIITTLDGEPLEKGQISGNAVDSSKETGHNNFQNFNKFLELGGKRGLQQQTIQAGTYNLNPWAVAVEEVPMTEIEIGHVGVVISFVGEEGVDVSGADFKHGNLVSTGQKGVLAEPLNPGKYAINKYTTRVEIVPTTNLVLNWADARTESHNLDEKLSTITVRSKDGFPFNLDVSQIIHIPMAEAPKVIARFGNMVNLVSQVLEPTIGNYFRNSAQDSDVISFLTSRKERQESAKSHIAKVLNEYNVQAVDTLIGDITPPESLMKTLTDRKIAQEQETTYEVQKKAQVQRQTLEKETAIAEMQKEIVKSAQGVEIADKNAEASVKTASGKAKSIKIAAEADSEAIKLKASADATRTQLIGEAEAGATLARGKANAESYKLAVDAMGKENFTTFKVTEEIGKSGIKLMPEVLINGGNGGGSIEGLMGLQILEKMGHQFKNLDANGDAKPEVKVVPVVPTEKKDEK